MTDIPTPLQQQSLETILDALASDSPTPGGGSVAAYTGAMAAGLLSMVCAIMLKRNNDNPDAEELRAIQQRAEAIRQELQQLAQADVEVFSRLSTAYKLPRTTEADAASRRTAIQQITRDAAEVPLQVAHGAARLMPLCTSLVHRSTRLLVSDVGVAATLARATVQSALLNVEINLAALDDQNYVRGVQHQMQDLTVGLTEETQGVLEIALGRIRP